MQTGIFFVILVAVFAVIIYLVFSGSLQGIGVEKLDLSMPSSRGRVIKGGEGGAVGEKSTGTQGQVGSKIEPKATSSISPRDIPEGFTLEQLSPYFKKIRLSDMSAGSVTSLGRVGLSTPGLEKEEGVNVTSWLIKGRRGGQHIPKAVEVYDPSGLTVESDIVLKKGETLNIYTSTSAIGRNLRLNKCIGYLQNTSKFVPALPKDCPRPNRSEVQNFSSRCCLSMITLAERI